MALTTRVDITAVKLLNDIILAGVGSSIYVYDKATSFLLQKVEVLRGQKIYGFVLSPSKDKVIVFGGKQFAVVSEENNGNKQKFRKSFEAIVCDDWLHSAIWIDSHQVAVLTAHNVVQKWDTSHQRLLSQYVSMNNSIMYSGLLLPLDGDVLVLAGTVFSEVLVHRCQQDKTLHVLKGHRGVIFSISCHPENKLIVTTSDDRSVRVWHLISKFDFNHRAISFWENCEIACVYEVYGHLARVMRSCITDTYIISVGEDAAVCFWSFNGKLLKKIIMHQNSPIWSVDADDKHLITGGGDCGVSLHPLTVAEYNGTEKIITIDKLKKVTFTARRNIVMLTEDDCLVYYDIELDTKEGCKLNHDSTYKLLSVSSCRQLIAVADMVGNLDIFAERGKDAGCLFKILNTKLNIGKMLSMHWAGNRHIVFCCDGGRITVIASNGANIELYSNFILPPCKERWLTAAATDSNNRIFMVGDRCGNIHVYSKGKTEPIKTFNKVHGRYGPTSITIKDKICSTGRNGTVKYFSINKENIIDIKFENSKDVEVQWVEKFLDKNESLVCGFQERYFVVFDLRNNSKILELSCGGGHRSWDAIRFIDKIKDDYEEIIRFVYVKNSDLHLIDFELSKLLTRNVINGSHSKEINSLKSYKFKNDNKTKYFISGGEDTTLRISKIDSDYIFRDLHIFKHLSSVKTLKIIEINDNKLLLISAGGRAQICTKILEFNAVGQETNIKIQDLIDYMIKGTDKERKGNRKWTEKISDFDPEMRVMDLAIQYYENEFIVFAGCSDAYIRIYKLIINTKQAIFESVQELKAHNTCILKANLLTYLDKCFLVTCTTRGEVAFWNVTDQENVKNFSKIPYFQIKTNKSGINCFSYIINNNKLLIATGGDDNTVHLNLIAKDSNSLKVVRCWSSSKFHCSQITGLFLLESHLVTTSIDQRVTLCKYSANDEDIKVELLSQIFSDVADIQGMDLVEETNEQVTVCVFGKGMEVLQMTKEIPRHL